MIYAQTHAFRQAQHEAREFNDNLRDTAAAVREMNAKLSEPQARSESSAAESAEPGTPTPEKTVVEARPAPNSSEAPDRARPAAPAAPALPALPDISHEVQLFVAAALRNQDTTVRAFQQVTALCDRQRAQLEELARQVKHLDRGMSHLVGGGCF